MSGKRLQGRVALVTGGSRGIGRATCELFAEEGAKVCVNYNTSRDEAEEIVEKIRSSGGEAMAVKADVSKEGEVKEMVETAAGRFGRIDILVNNAGILKVGDLFNLKDEDLDAMFATNVKGVIYCTREVSKYMIRENYGKIVNVASNSGFGTAFKGTTGYAITKAAVILLTRKLAFEFRGGAIQVNCVAPGYTESDMTTQGRTPEEHAKGVAEVSSRTMMSRIATPIEIARAILFLSSDDASFTTGEVLMADGGRMDYLVHS